MNRLAMILVVIALLTGIALGAWLRPAASVKPSAAPAQDAVLYWYDPMHPDQHFDKPGRSPFMDMDLVPKYANAASEGGDGVQIDARTAQNLGVRVVKAERGVLRQPLTVAGTIAFDASAVEVVQARARGYLERVHARRVLAPVRAGEPLADLVAPEWAAALAEYHALRAMPGSDLAALRKAARQRLQVLGVPDAAIRQSERTGAANGRVTLVAPRDGVLAAIDAREGQAVEPGMPLFRINGLDQVWVEAAVPEAHAAALRSGLPVQIEVPAWPGRSFDGTIAAVLPQVDPVSRTLGVRIVLENTDHALAPGMLARVRLRADDGRQRVLVPSEAVITTGTRSVVIVEESAGRFMPHEVRTGAEANGRTEILEGLDSGARVVASGQFLIDSEANLRGSLRRLGPDPSQSSASGHEHADHAMPAAAPTSTPAMDHEHMNHAMPAPAPAPAPTPAPAPAMDHEHMNHAMPAPAPAPAPAKASEHEHMNHAMPGTPQ